MSSVAAFSGAAAKRWRRFFLRASALLLVALICTAAYPHIPFSRTRKLSTCSGLIKSVPSCSSDFPDSPTTRSKRRTPMLMVAQSSRISATTHSAAGNSVTWCIMSAAETLFAS